MALNFVEVTSWRLYFSCRGYSSSMLTWKYCLGAVFVAGDFVLSFFVGGDSGEGGGVAGLWMIGEGVVCAVFGGLCTVMVAVSICSVCGAGGCCLLLLRFQLSACWRRRSGCQTSGWCGRVRPLVSRGCRPPPTFSPLVVETLVSCCLSESHLYLDVIFPVCHSPYWGLGELVLSQGVEKYCRQ